MDELIFKKQALDAINKCREDYNISEQEQIDDCENAVRELQPVTERTGHWITHIYKYGDDRYECSECSDRCNRVYNYCPHCGAKMEVEHGVC